MIVTKVNKAVFLMESQAKQPQQSKKSIKASNNQFQKMLDHEIRALNPAYIRR